MFVRPAKKPYHDWQGEAGSPAEVCGMDDASSRHLHRFQACLNSMTAVIVAPEAEQGICER